MPRRDHGGSLRDAFGAVGAVRRLAERFRKLSTMQKVGIVFSLSTLAIAIIGVIVTFVVGFPSAVSSCRSLGWGWCSLSSSEPPQASQPSASTGPGGGTAPDAAPSSADSSGSSGAPEMSAGCYRDDVAVACSVKHTAEVYSPTTGNSCDSDSLVTYLGGGSSWNRRAQCGSDCWSLNSGASLCVVKAASGSDLPSATLKELWTTDADRNGYNDGGQFRRCLSYQGRRPHAMPSIARRFFYEGATDVNCDEKYSAFARRDARTDARDIKVSRLTSGDSVLCQVEVKAREDSLFASVRDLGSTTLPIKH